MYFLANRLWIRKCWKPLRWMDIQPSLLLREYPSLHKKFSKEGDSNGSPGYHEWEIPNQIHCLLSSKVVLESHYLETFLYAKKWVKNALLKSLILHLFNRHSKYPQQTHYHATSFLVLRIKREILKATREKNRKKKSRLTAMGQESDLHFS
jgi:hypothetical protein